VPPPAPAAAAFPYPASAPPQHPGTAVRDAFPDTGAGARDPSRPSRPPALVIDDPALSLPTPARRPWALIAVVLLIDIGLAVSGTWMLTQGLGGSSGAASSDTSPPRSR
jgi:hypothetical protein